MYYRNKNDLEQRIDAATLFDDIKVYLNDYEKVRAEYLQEFPEYKGEVIVNDVVADWFLQDWILFKNECEEVRFAFENSWFGISSDIKSEYEKYVEAKLTEWEKESKAEMRGIPCYNM